MIKNNLALNAYLIMFGACVMCGLMATIDKETMTYGIDGFEVVL